MHSRRQFVSVVAAGLGAALVPDWVLAQDGIKTSLNGPVGSAALELREYLPKDLSGTLAKVRRPGLPRGRRRRAVEALGRRSACGAGLRRPALSSRRTCRTSGCGTIPRAHSRGKAVGRRVGRVPMDSARQGLHARERARRRRKPSTGSPPLQKGRPALRLPLPRIRVRSLSEGTLFDTLAGATDPARVLFQIDVFHALFGGADPAQLIDRYQSRVASLHLKDLKKGYPIKAGTAIAPADADVPVGSGQVDMPSVLRSAAKAATSLYYVEDESADPLTHIPQSVAYLKTAAPA